VLDAEGYVRLDELAAALRSAIPEADEPLIRAVVTLVEPHKQRYAIEGDFVRANYGHSTAERIAHAPETPPATLFHGTSRERLEDIFRDGLKPMKRQYVHLTPDVDLALSVGARHGAPCLVRVDATAAHAAGLTFHKANHSFWLVADVPTAYLTAI
jgi:putative RNA 2'-phosphotransferase